jgi:hypothetical protein
MVYFSDPDHLSMWVRQEKDEEEEQQRGKEVVNNDRTRR